MLSWLLEQWWFVFIPSEPHPKPWRPNWPWVTWWKEKHHFGQRIIHQQYIFFLKVQLVYKISHTTLESWTTHALCTTASSLVAELLLTVYLLFQWLMVWLCVWIVFFFSSLRLCVLSLHKYIWKRYVSVTVLVLPVGLDHCICHQPVYSLCIKAVHPSSFATFSTLKKCTRHTRLRFSQIVQVSQPLLLYLHIPFHYFKSSFASVGDTAAAVVLAPDYRERCFCFITAVHLV